MDRVKLGDYIHVKHGWAFKGEHFVDAGSHIVLTPANFFEEGGFKETPGKEKYYNADFPSEYLCRKGDLIVVMTQQAEGLLGATARVPTDNTYLHNQRIGLITAIRDDIDLTFVDYLMRTPWVRFQLERTASGSKVRHTSPEKIEDVDVCLPQYEDQIRIGSILSAIDNKIANNKKLMAELESTARLIYDYWFTQFDFPDENGKPYRSSGGKMVYNDTLHREIPIDWGAGVLSDLLDITMGQSPAGDSYNEKGFGEVFYQGRVDFGDYYPTKRMYTTSPSRFAETDDVLLSVRAPVGDVNWAFEDCCIGRGLAALRDKCGSPFFASFLVTSFSSVFGRMNGSGTTFGAIDKQGLTQLQLPLPPKEIVGRYAETAEQLYREFRIAETEQRELEKLRDWLLPMLMNGQVVAGEQR
ncbi:MAG: restriction endonuclease subunit S [Eggerthellaceae bacterium]|nr:restriction endonuclease subunit S [Eggerthellaceae bacterium]